MKLTNKVNFKELVFDKFRLTGMSFISEFWKYLQVKMGVYLQVFSTNHPEKRWYLVTDGTETNVVKRHKSRPCNCRTGIWSQ